MIEYRIYLDKEPADKESLGKIDSLVITQDLETASEALLTIPICADAEGNWKSHKLNSGTDIKEVRVDIKADDKTWVPVIDGVVIGSNVNISGDPGKSAFVMVVQDDSYYLNRNDTVMRFPDGDITPEKILRQSFDKLGPTRPVDYKFDTPTNNKVGVDFTQRGKVMTMLQEMAKRHRSLLYLQPAPATVGQNIVHFRQVPEEIKTTHTMTVLGEKRNVEEFELKENRDSNRNVASASLSFSNKTTRTLKTRVLLTDAPEPPQKAPDPPSIDNVPSMDDPELAKDAETWAKSFTHEASGSLLGRRFKSVLRPGDYVLVATGNESVSGKYLVRAVVHTLNRFAYIQEFQLKRTRPVATPAPDPLGGII